MSSEECRIAIVLFVYRRIDKTKRLLESLLKCVECSTSDLIIFSDEAVDESCKGEVDEVRIFIDNITGFKSVKVCKRSSNYGIEKNVMYGLNEVFESYDAAVVLEDDLEVASDFLGFMYKALKKYQAYEKVNSITGYSYLTLGKTGNVWKQGGGGTSKLAA